MPGKNHRSRCRSMHSATHTVTTKKLMPALLLLIRNVVFCCCACKSSHRCRHSSAATALCRRRRCCTVLRRPVSRTQLRRGLGQVFHKAPQILHPAVHCELFLFGPARLAGPAIFNPTCTTLILPETMGTASGMAADRHTTSKTTQPAQPATGMLTRDVQIPGLAHHFHAGPCRVPAE